MKRVKKIGNYHTLETAARAEETDLLCDQCGNVECPLRMIFYRVKINRLNAKIAVTRCESFVAMLVFRDAAGLGSSFNTFRLGGAWAKRVVPGDVVSLRDGSNEVVGSAVVEATHVGKFSELVEEFGVDNHLAIDAELSGKDFDLAKVMTECYGGHRFNVHSTVSILDLRRIDGVGEEGEADLRSLP